MPPKPYSQACENNKDPILAVLREWLADSRQVLELGSGTGQHAVHFARALGHLVWQPSDLSEHHPGIQAWRDEAGLPNLRPPLRLDVDAPDWPEVEADAAFTANTHHIMHWPSVERLYQGVGRILPAGGLLVVYGPFRYGGNHTSPSNARFDQSLRARDPGMGVRDFEAVERLARAQGLVLEDDRPMPANNRTLVWRRAAGAPA